MPTYAIGDIQGCVDALSRLLDHIKFDQSRDHLWFVGDLVNRGPHSLEVLRFVKGLGTSAVTVLGNHDLHLLAVWAKISTLNRKDTLQSVLSASDVDELLTWLRFRPLVHADNGYVMIHAGLLPSWSIPQVMEWALEVETVLQSDSFQKFLPSLYFHKTAGETSSNLSTKERLSLTTNVLTRLRVCTKDGIPNFSFKGLPEDAPPGYLPWFRIPHRASRHDTIVFGHWSALGVVREHSVLALDGGCVWGRELIACRLEDQQLFRIPCPKV